MGPGGEHQFPTGIGSMGKHGWPGGHQTSLVHRFQTNTYGELGDYSEFYVVAIWKIGPEANELYGKISKESYLKGI